MSQGVEKGKKRNGRHFSNCLILLESEIGRTYCILWGEITVNIIGGVSWEFVEKYSKKGRYLITRAQKVENPLVEWKSGNSKLIKERNRMKSNMIKSARNKEEEKIKMYIK